MNVIYPKYTMQPNITGARIAVGHKARVGKDTFAGHFVATYGGRTFAFGAKVHETAAAVARIVGAPPEKNPALLQFIGNGLKQFYGEDVWVKPVLAQIDSVIATDPERNIIVSDLRHTVELEALKARGFIIIDIIRPGRPIDRDPADRSETELDSAEFDYTIINDGTQAEYLDTIDLLISKIFGL